MNDLFSKLFRYIPSENASPLENYLTEILAYLIKKSGIFRKNFFDLIGINEAEISTICEDDIQTQFYHEGSVFDILISNSNLEIIIENKVDSGFGQGQLKKYKEYLSNLDSKLTRLITITKSLEFEGLKYADANLTWYELYEKLLDDKKIVSYEERYVDYFFNLKNFLKELDMGIEKVTWEIVRGIEAEKNLIKQIDIAFNDLIKEENFRELKIKEREMKRGHLRQFGFYAYKTISKGNIAFNLYYILEKITIICCTRKKNLKHPDEFPTAEWDSNLSVIDKFEVTKGSFLGMELNEQIEALKSWGRTVIKKFLDNIIKTD